MYTEQDYEDIRTQLGNRLIAFGIPAVLLLAGVVVSLVYRVEWATILLTALLGCACVFVYGLLLSPVIAYKKHLDGVLHGRTREIAGQFKEMGEAPALRDGVQFFPVTLSVGRMDEPKDDRLFYFDANLPRPAWQPGDALVLTVHDKAIGAWKTGAQTE